MTAGSNTKSYSNLKKSSGHGRLIAVVAAGLVVFGALCAVFGKQVYAKYQHEKQVSAVLDTDTFYEGITVQGVAVGGMTMQQAEDALKSKEQSARGTYDIKITYGSKKWELTQDDMAFTYNTAAVLKEAYGYGRSGSREERYRQVNGLKLQPKNYAVTASPDENDLKAKVEKTAAQVTRKPQEPTVVSFDKAAKSFTFKDGVDGLTVDSDALWKDVKAVVEGKRTGTVNMRVQTVPFDKSVAEVKSHMQKLGTFSTTSTNNANGTYNMKRALASVNGTCVPAGGTFSFLGTVGQCDQAHGYRPAGAIQYGKLIQEYGGGICQASTTVYGAALRSDMEITERCNHSMPSSYCPIGQDATVSYPGLDFKFKNPTDYPIYILTQSSGKVLTVTFYGYQPPDYDDIQIASKVIQSYPAPSQPKYVLDETLPSGTVKQTAKAHTGYKVTAQRVFYKNGAAVKTESLPSSYYKPLPAYYSYGKGTDASKIGGTGSSSAPSSQKPESKPSSQASSPSSGTKSGASQPSSGGGSSSDPQAKQETANDDVAA